MIAVPTVVPAVTVSLLDYLHARLGVSDLSYRKNPTQITDGWETYIYRFQLQGEGLPEPFAQPLVLRVYASPQGTPRLENEYAAQTRLGEMGYPVSEPILLEEDCNLFGGPFMIMQAIPGRTLLDLLLHHPWRIWGGPGQMAAMHAQLHQLPPDQFSSPRRPFLDRRLEEMESLIVAYDLPGLRKGWEWLNRNRPASPTDGNIIHLDFHPVNLMFYEGECRGVLDWCESDVGDRHADVATSLVLIHSAPVEVPTFLQRASTWPGRSMLRRRYLRAYRRLLPLDDRKLSYYMAFASLRRLCNWGTWLRAGPRVTGSKPSSMRYLSSDRVDILRNLFQRWAQGTTVQL